MGFLWAPGGWLGGACFKFTHSDGVLFARRLLCFQASPSPLALRVPRHSAVFPVLLPPVCYRRSGEACGEGLDTWAAVGCPGGGACWGWGLLMMVIKVIIRHLAEAFIESESQLIRYPWS